MTDQSIQFPRFYVTAPAPCPYLPNRWERKVFTELKGEDADALNEALSRVGFRRSQSVAYRPACEGCAACISVRVVAGEFRPARSMRRILTRNRDLATRILDPVVTDEQFDLLKRYLGARHPQGGMAEMSAFEYAEMVQHTPVCSRLIEYRLPSGDGAPGPLVAACLTDFMSDGLSMVYSFFAPGMAARSLGSYIILHHIEEARRRHLDHVYLGYWIKGSAKMAYKARFQPLERLGPHGWAPMTDSPRHLRPPRRGGFFL